MGCFMTTLAIFGFVAAGPVGVIIFCGMGLLFSGLMSSVVDDMAPGITWTNWRWK